MRAKRANLRSKFFSLKNFQFFNEFGKTTFFQFSVNAFVENLLVFNEFGKSKDFPIFATSVSEEEKG